MNQIENITPAVELIQKYEGLRLQAYLCPAGVPTIGYGLTKYADGSSVKLGDEITENQAVAYLLEEIEVLVKWLQKAIQAPLSNNEFCALISFVYNIGFGAFYISTMRKYINDPRIPRWKAGDEFDRWIYAKGKILPGLAKRRMDEKQLFLS